MMRDEIEAMKAMRLGAVCIRKIRPSVRVALIAHGLAAEHDHGGAWAQRNPGYVRRVLDLTAKGRQALRWVDATPGERR